MEQLIENNLASVGWFRPELVLTFGSIALFLLDLIWQRSPARRALLTAAAVATLGLAGAFLAAQPAESVAIFNGLLASDLFATFFKWLFLAAALLTILIVAQGDDFPNARVGEFYALLMAVVLGLFIMASATNLLTIYLGIELVSMVSYVLAGFRRKDRKATEASLKYVIYGSVASGVMLFGMSYLFGLLGTADVLAFGPKIAALAGTTGAAAAATKLALVVAVVFVSSGVGYKIASVPWHMWCPDVYEGAPTSFTAFLSVGPKAAGFALALRLFYVAFAGPMGADGLAASVAGIPWPAVIGVLSAVTMTLGNLTALGQTNLKRLLAYSSISHAGYALMGLATVSALGIQGVMIYMLIYLVMNLGAFLVVIVVAQATGSESILDYRGLARRHPLAAVTFAIFLFSLTGLPPFAGFTGKWYLFYAVIERAAAPGGFWYGALALVAALNTAVALYYYARVIKAMFLDAPYVTTPVEPKVGYQLMLGVFSAAVLVFGIWWAPLVDWSQRSLTMLRG
ncbi:NADH-quinone oxidoreductase subunit N [Anaeromyxobacter diazotrophicus]|uniref:NADH-quinone oxidoreductase subunit N n=1 Tax=Anaeromyxobacter diazotrophicus TaxID=2590199 RepID=A0A7I9VN97_9BACT|nr:NADH-quinone oxidoreductase subunit N [Anaeromyxobacter diazotrophicus]GEJ57885.1 NADH-quinone oxidoreductase subunit N [Anaeromyxobacter diazotrophicus]